MDEQYNIERTIPVKRASKDQKVVNGNLIESTVEVAVVD